MRTQTDTYQLFKFAELSESAQAHAIDKWRDQDTQWNWADEWRDSLKTFSRVLNITLRNWEVSITSPSFVQWNYSPDNCTCEDLHGLRLRTWLINNWLPHFRKGKYYSLNHGAGYKHRYSRCQFEYNNCPLTGYCGDMALIDPILQFIAKPEADTNLHDIIENCFSQWCTEWTADMEYQISDEYIRETLEINEYEFTENGNIH